MNNGEMTKAISNTHREIVAFGVIMAGIALTAVAVGLMLRFGAGEHVLRLLDWLGGLGAWGPVLFIVIQSLIVILLIPGVLFTLGAGFLFGLVRGSAYMVAGNVFGGAIAFMAARTLLRKPVARLLQQRPPLRMLDENLSDHGWKVILLTRMIPFFPFKLSNYFFGVMKFSFRDFVIGTAFGVIPITLTNVYAGSLAGDLATMESMADRGLFVWILYGGGLVALMLLVVLMGRFARRTLNSENYP